MITKHLQECLQYIPKGKWFEFDEIPYAVSRKQWVCNRLVSEGVLQERTEWVVDDDKGMEGRTDFRTRSLYFFIEPPKQ